MAGVSRVLTRGRTCCEGLLRRRMVSISEFVVIIYFSFLYIAFILTYFATVADLTTRVSECRRHAHRAFCRQVY